MDIVKKISEDGSASPFGARIFPGLLIMRDQLFLFRLHGKEYDQQRDLFDAKMGPLYQSALATRDAALEINRLISEHVHDIQHRGIIRIEENQFSIDKTIDIPLHQVTDKLLDQSIVALHGLQRILKKPLGLHIGFLFQQNGEFKQGITKLRRDGEIVLANYLVDVRTKWLWNLIGVRNAAQHEGWQLPEIVYKPTMDKAVLVTLPQIGEVRIDLFARVTANRVLLFIENMMVHTMARNIPDGIYIIEIPKSERNPENPVRFTYGGVGLSTSPRWHLQYEEDMDFV